MVNTAEILNSLGGRCNRGCTNRKMRNRKIIEESLNSFCRGGGGCSNRKCGIEEILWKSSNPQAEGGIEGVVIGK